MAAASSLSTRLHDLRDITKCSICLSTFTDPRALPCIHTFCLQCLQQYCEDKNPGEEAGCPLCRMIFTVPQGGIQHMPKNFFIGQLLHVNQSPTAVCLTKSDIPATCELCSESQPATSFCVQCDQCICDKCIKMHQKLKVSELHQVVPVQDAPNLTERMKSVVRYCEEHPDKPIEIYCNDCKTTSCLMCHAVGHKNHNCTDVKKSGETFRGSLITDLEKVSSCVLKSQKKLKQLEFEKQKFILDVANTEEDISNQCDQLVSLGHAHQRQLVDKLNLFKDNRLKEMEADKDELERELTMRESFKIYGQEMVDKGSACDISRAGQALRTRAKELIMTPEVGNECSRVEITFTPSFTSGNRVKNAIGQLSFEEVRCEDISVTSVKEVPVKVVLLGSSSSGKTSICKRFTHDYYPGPNQLPHEATIGAAYHNRNLLVGGRNVKLEIWDTAGHEAYDKLTPMYIHGTHAAIMCYDLMKQETYERALFWEKRVKELNKDCKIYFCGTKVDMVKGENAIQREIVYQTACNSAIALNAGIIETSSKTGENILELFTMVAEDFLKNPKNSTFLESLRTGLLARKSEKKKSEDTCCIQ